MNAVRAVEPVERLEVRALLDDASKIELTTHRQNRGAMLRRLLLGADVAALVTAFAIAQFYGGIEASNTPFSLKDAIVLAVSIPLWVVFAQAHNLYHVNTRRADHGVAEELGPVLHMTTVWSWALLLLWSVSGEGPVSIPKIVIFWATSNLLLLAFRAVVRVSSRRRVWYIQNALILGDHDAAGSMIRRILRHPEYGINVVACLDTSDRAAGSEEIGFYGHVPILRSAPTDTVALVKALDIERLIFTPSAGTPEHRVELITELSSLPDLHIDLVPSGCELVGPRLELHQMEGVPLLTVPHTKFSRSALAVKRSMDIVVSGAALVLLAPLLVMCAIAIKLETRGSVFFRQRRVGRDDRCFEVLKFRSMVADADHQKDEVAALNFHGGGNVEGMFKIREDPRITRVGRLLRRFSLDELPQLINVLKGDMSLVGPRPLIETEDRQVEGHFRRRLSLTPGVTGLWQVNGRSDIPFDEMVNLDYLYVTSWTLWGDVKLLLKTVPAVFRGAGAY